MHQGRTAKAGPPFPGMIHLPESSLVLSILRESTLVPFGASLAVLAAGRALRLQSAGTAVALAAGFLASYFAVLHAQWSPVPQVALDWTPWIVLAALAGALATEKLPGAGARFSVRLALALAAAALIVWPALVTFGAQKAAIAIVATGLPIALVWSVAAPVAHGGASRPLLLAVVAGGAGIALLLDSSPSVGRLSGAQAAALCACMVFNLPRVRVAFSPAAAGVTVMVLGTLLANAHLYAGFPLGYVALIVGALLVDPVLAKIHRLRRKAGDGPSWIPGAVLTAIPVMVTVALAVKAAQDSGVF
jgi:hypothetical protein